MTGRRWRAGVAAKPAEKSIAVLFFENLSGVKEDEYLRDGITEDIITELSKIKGLKILSRPTVLPYRDKPVTAAQVGQQLKAAFVLAGSLRRGGNRLRITAQLVDGATDSHVWAERFDRNLDDIFALQDEIAEAIVKALKLKLLPAEKQAIEQRGTTNPEAYKLYLMARQFNATGSSRHREIVFVETLNRLARSSMESTGSSTAASTTVTVKLHAAVLPAASVA